VRKFILIGLLFGLFIQPAFSAPQLTLEGLFNAVLDGTSSTLKVGGIGQASTTLNSQTVSAANSAIVKTVTGISNTKVYIYQLSAACSAGTASLTIQDGATTIWSTPSTGVGTTLLTFSWQTALATTVANNAVITLSTCGVANTGTLNVQASQY
jgi:predicted amidohydrolase